MKSRLIYLLTPPPAIGGRPQPYGSLGAVAADPDSGLQITRQGLRYLHNQAHGRYPLLVRGYTLDQLSVRTVASIKAEQTAAD